MRADERVSLDDMQRFLRAEGAVLQLRPWLLLQQAANQDYSSSLASGAIARLNRDTSHKPWLRRLGRASGAACLTTLVGHDWEVQCCAWSPDGETIVSGASDFTLRLWDPATGRERAALRPRGQPKACAFSPDSRHLASAAGEQLQIWDVETATESARFPRGHERWILDVKFSRDGSRLATASLDRTVKVWDVTSRRELFTLRGHEGVVRTCAFSPDGSLLLSGSDDGTLRLWDLSEARELVTLRLDSRIGFIQGGRDVVACDFSPDGLRAVSADATGQLRLWDIERRVQIASARWPAGGSLLTCAFSPTGDRIAAGTWAHGEVRIWDAELRGELAALHGHSRAVNDCAFSPDGKRLVSASGDHTLRVWDTSSHAGDSTPTRMRSSIKACASSPDGSRVVSAGTDATLAVHEVEPGRVATVLSGHRFWVTDCAFSRDGTKIFSAGQDETIRVWDAVTGTELHSLRGHRNGVLAIAPDDSRVVGWSREGVAGLYELNARQPLFTLPSLDIVHPVCVFSPDGSMIIAKTATASLAVCDARDGRVLATFLDRLFGRCLVAFAPDGETVATACSEIALWETATWSKTATLERFASNTHSLGFSADGGRVLAAIAGKAIRMWDARSGAAIADLSGHKSFAQCCLFSPSGAWIVSGSSDGVARLWNGETGTLAHEYFFPAGADGVTAVAWRRDDAAFLVATDAGDLLVEMR